MLLLLYFFFAEILEMQAVNWRQVEGQLRTVSCHGGPNAVYGVNSGGNIYRWTGNGWTQVPGGLAQLDVSTCGRYVWGVNSGGNIYRADHAAPGQWNQVAGGLSHVSHGSGVVWGVNKDGGIYQCKADGNWVKVSA